MNSTSDQRQFERIPLEKPVQVRSKGRLACYAAAVNISMGGLLLGAAAPLPVGTPCELAIAVSDAPGAKTMLARGVVVRAGATETAIRFTKALDQTVLEKLVSARPVGPVAAFFRSYVDYFKVSQDKDYAGCETLFGVTQATFRKVIMSTFSVCIPLAILPVWLFRTAIPPGANLLKILLAFGYGLVWLAAIQPIADLMIFKYLRSKKVKQT